MEEAMTSVERLWVVDSARGIAIIMMVISNFLFDLFLFKGLTELYSGFWLYFARVTAALFILLVGVSLTLSYSRVKEKSRNFLVKKYVKRGLKIFAIGLLITAASWFAVGPNLIIFGILHLIGLSVILSYPFLRMKHLNLFFGVVLIIIGLLIENIIVNFPWLVWLGLKYPGFNSVDYVPVFPWLGFSLIGIFLGNLIFPKRIFRDRSKFPLVKILAWLGRNSLIIYVIHQPVLVGIVLFLL